MAIQGTVPTALAALAVGKSLMLPELWGRTSTPVPDLVNISDGAAAVHTETTSCHPLGNQWGHLSGQDVEELRHLSACCKARAVPVRARGHLFAPYKPLGLWKSTRVQPGLIFSSGRGRLRASADGFCQQFSSPQEHGSDFIIHACLGSSIQSHWSSKLSGSLFI